MILPIVAYGDPVLTTEAEDITKDYPELQKLIADMFETMYNASGVGLAAPQIGKSIRLFIVDTAQLMNGEAEDEDTKETNETKIQGIKKVFINAVLLEESGTPWSYTEGCLSIPNIREDVVREEWIRIEYYDENFVLHEEEYGGINARVILHEYDHTDGILFTDLLSPIRKRLLKRKLNRISKGDINVEYRMRFPLKK